MISSHLMMIYTHYYEHLDAVLYMQIFHDQTLNGAIQTIVVTLFHSLFHPLYTYRLWAGYTDRHATNNIQLFQRTTILCFVHKLGQFFVQAADGLEGDCLRRCQRRRATHEDINETGGKNNLLSTEQTRPD